MEVLFRNIFVSVHVSFSNSLTVKKKNERKEGRSWKFWSSWFNMQKSFFHITKEKSFYTKWNFSCRKFKLKIAFNSIVLGTFTVLGMVLYMQKAINLSKYNWIELQGQPYIIVGRKCLLEPLNFCFDYWN